MTAQRRDRGAACCCDEAAPQLRQIRHATSSGAQRRRCAAGCAPRARHRGDARWRWPKQSAFLAGLDFGIEMGGERAALPPVKGSTQGHRFRSSSRASPTRRARRFLRDGTRDTGCGLKAFRREVFLAMPYFRRSHRFLPALVRREGYETPMSTVIDRARRSGVSELRILRSLWIGNHGSRWGVVVDPPQESTPVATRCSDVDQFGQDLGNYLYDVFVAKFDFWLASGWSHNCFSRRVFWCSGFSSERPPKRGADGVLAFSMGAG